MPDVPEQAPRVPAKLPRFVSAILAGLGVWGLLAVGLLTAIALQPAIHRAGPAVDELLSGIDGTPRHDPQPVGLGSLRVPDIRGAGLHHAQTVLAAAGLNAEVRTAPNATQIEAGEDDRWIVCASDPRSGATALRGTVVTLVVSDRGCD